MVLRKIESLLGRAGEGMESAVFTLLRVLASAMFMTHGYGKLFGDNPQVPVGGGMTTVNIGDLISFPMPLDINALYVAGVIELFAAALILIGFCTRLMALLATVLMLMAYATAHLAWFPTLNNGELAAMYFLTFLTIFSFGPGPLSIDSWLELHRQQKKKQSMFE